MSSENFKLMLMINSGQNESLVTLVSSLQCLENTEGGEPDIEQADCNFHKDKQWFFYHEFPQVLPNTKLLLIACMLIECLCQRLHLQSAEMKKTDLLKSTQGGKKENRGKHDGQMVAFDLSVAFWFLCDVSRWTLQF